MKKFIVIVLVLLNILEQSRGQTTATTYQTSSYWWRFSVQNRDTGDGAAGSYTREDRTAALGTATRPKLFRGIPTQ